MIIKLIDHHATNRNRNTQWLLALNARGIAPTQPVELLRDPIENENLQKTAVFLHAGRNVEVRNAWMGAVRDVPNAFLCLISANGPQELIEPTDMDKANGIYALRWTPQQFPTDQNAHQFVLWLTQQLQ